MKIFNDNQLKVINNLDDNILLTATAGTGKTETLTNRVVNIIDSNRAEPKEILCITFTNKACKEMKERITKNLGVKAQNIVIKTFHGWCFDIIKKESKKHTDLFADFIIYDEIDCEQVIEEARKKLLNSIIHILKLINLGC